MPTTDELELAFPDIDAPVSGGEPCFGRILVPVRAPGEAAEALAVAARVSSAINGVLSLVHVRIYDPPLRGAGRFYPETVGEAAAVLDEALLTLWASGLRAATAVVTAQRGQVAAAIARQASAWPADVIVLTRRRRPAIGRLVLGSVSDQVMRVASCPVLAVHPRREPSHGRFSRHVNH